MAGRIATIRPDFKMPEPPVTQCSQCESAVIPYAYWTGDGFLFFWECSPDCGHIGEQEFLIEDWPFVEDIARAEDIEAAGFTFA